MQELIDKYDADGEERCGFLLQDGSIVEVKNMSTEPKDSYVIDVAEILKYEDRIKATWHTHPGLTSNLSGEDYKGFLNYPEYLHYIVGEDGVSCFSVQSGVIVRNDG